MGSKRLVLYCHGSTDPRWRSTFENLAAQVRRDLGEGNVSLAYMEFARPTLEEAAAEAVGAGCTGIRLLPLFLSGGAHLSKEMPEQVAAVRKAHPDLDIDVMPPIGELPRFTALIEEIVKESIG